VLNFFTKEDYMKYVEQGYISRKEHPEDSNVVILNYTEQTVFERKWNGITLQCRGLILNEATGEVLARPFPKFFNYGETSGLNVSIPQSQPEITIKHDGSLGIMYRLNGKIRWATRGSFVSDQAKIAQEIWDQEYSQYENVVPNEITLLAEIIHPLTRVVVDYNGLEDLILIGMTNRFTGSDYNHMHLNAFVGSQVPMPVTDKVKGSLQEILNVAKTLNHNEEGFVLSWDDPSGGNKIYRLKVKGNKYLEVHRIIHGMSLKQKVESWANGNLIDYIKSLPEEFRPEIEDTAFKCESILIDILQDVYKYYQIAEKRGRKNYALWMQKNAPTHLHGFLWLLYDGEIIQMNDKMKQYIVKNYRELIGGNNNG
jgi:RNA ligase